MSARYVAGIRPRLASWEAQVYTPKEPGPDAVRQAMYSTKRRGAGPFDVTVGGWCPNGCYLHATPHRDSLLVENIGGLVDRRAREGE